METFKLYLKRTVALALFCAVAFSLFSSLSVSAEYTDSLKTVRVSCGLNRSLYLDENGEPEGYCADYIRALATINHWNIEYVEGATNESIQNLADGKVDIVFPLQITEERSEFMSFSSISGGYQPIYLFAKNDSGIYFNDFNAFDGARIAVTPDSSNEEELIAFAAKQGFAYTPVYIDSMKDKVVAVENGEADFIAASTVYSVDDFFVVAVMDCVPFYFAVAKGNDELLSELNNGIQQMLIDQSEISTNASLGFLKSGVRFAHTEAEDAWLKNDGKVVVGVYMDTPPMYHSKKGEDAHGIYVDILALLEEKTGADIELYPINRDTYAYDLIDNGTIDVLVGSNDASLKAQNNAKYIFSAPLLDYTTVTISRHNYSQNQTENPVFVLTSARQYWESMILEKYPDAIIHYSKNAKDCLLEVQSGKADITLLNAWEFNFQSKNLRFSDLIEWENNRIIADIVMSASADADKTMLSILDKGISGISTSEATEIITVNLNHQYDEYTLADKLYAYRSIVTGVTVTCILLIVFFIIYHFMRKGYITSLETKNEELVRASNAKTEFLSRMSHDMRTPMNGVLGLAALIKDEDDLPTIKRDIGQMEMSGKYLLRLINDTLDMSKIESGRLELHETPIDSEALFGNILANAAIMAKAKGVSLNIKTPEILHGDWVTVYADASRLEQIIMNILSNAIKFTPEGGSVDMIMETVSISETTVTDRYIIRDSGIGISEEFLPHIFEPFSQEGRSNTERENGTGLGMPIVKQLVDLMGGKISIRSKVGEGTEVSLLMTYKACRTPSAHEEVQQEVQQEKADVSVLNGKRVLLCEDHPLNATISERLLKKVGITTEHAENGKVGLDMFAASEPGYYDAVLMDIRMPVMDGLASAKSIRALSRPDAAAVPIIAMTANAYEEDIRKSKDAGMNAHVAKPVDPDQLFNTLAGMIK